mmetsp:Transcript_13479/g.28930  ORF Transcript_13479/g.28930 Transcript_13479/m.28930 type:complete len:84 (+) Transcript_13479:742-993(+)
MPAMLPEGECKLGCNREVDWKKRDDDTNDIIKLRMEVYHKETKPVLKYWEERDQLLRFVPYNGVDDMDKLVPLVENHLTNVSD